MHQFYLFIYDEINAYKSTQKKLHITLHIGVARRCTG